MDVEGMSQEDMQAAYEAKVEEAKTAKRARQAAARALRLVRGAFPLHCMQWVDKYGREANYHHNIGQRLQCTPGMPARAGSGCGGRWGCSGKWHIRGMGLLLLGAHDTLFVKYTSVDLPYRSGGCSLKPSFSHLRSSCQTMCMVACYGRCQDVGSS